MLCGVETRPISILLDERCCIAWEILRLVFSRNNLIRFQEMQQACGGVPV